MKAESWSTEPESAPASGEIVESVGKREPFRFPPGIEHPAKTPAIPRVSPTGAAHSGAEVGIDPVASFLASLTPEQRARLAALLAHG